MWIANPHSLGLLHSYTNLTIITLRQNGRDFPDDIFKCIFVNENVGIPIKISLKFVPRGPINNIPALVQKMAGADKAIADCLTQWWLVHYIDVIMTTMVSQITSLAVVYSIVYSGADQRKHQSSASLAFVRVIHRDRWIPRTKGQ